MREALDSVEAVHRESSFRPKRSRRIQKLPATGDLKSSASTTASTCSIKSEESGQSGASYLSFTYVPEDGHYMCRRHYHDGSGENYGRTALVFPDVAPSTDQ